MKYFQFEIFLQAFISVALKFVVFSIAIFFFLAKSFKFLSYQSLPIWDLIKCSSYLILPYVLEMAI